MCWPEEGREISFKLGHSSVGKGGGAHFSLHCHKTDAMRTAWISLVEEKWENKISTEGNEGWDDA